MIQLTSYTFFVNDDVNADSRTFIPAPDIVDLDFQNAAHLRATR